MGGCHIAGASSKFPIIYLHGRPNSGVPRLTIVAARAGLRCCNALCIVQLFTGRGGLGVQVRQGLRVQGGGSLGCETGAGQGRTGQGMAGELKSEGIRNWELDCPIGPVDV